MFVSDKYQLIFLEVPRTGSNSITRALTQMDPDSPTAKKRVSTPMFEYHAFKIPKHAQDYRILATHRNPYERLWSHWKHRHKHGAPKIFKTTGWIEYVDWVLNPSAYPQFKNAVIDIPVTSMNNIDRVTHWLRFSHLGEDWLDVCKQLSLPEISLDFLNSSQQISNVSAAYSEELRSAVFDHFADDFEHFGYSRDSLSLESSQAEQQSDVRTSQEPASIQQLEPTTTNKPAVAIFTSLAKSDPAYSLNRVIQDQIDMFIDQGYRLTVIVIDSDHWDNSPQDNFDLPQIDLIKLPKVFKQEFKKLDKEDQILKIIDVLQPALKDISVVITHDLIYQPSQSDLCNAALICAQEMPSLRWLHWIHSATNVATIFNAKGMTPGIAQQLSSWPNSKVVGFNQMAARRLGQQFNCSESEVGIVPHPINVEAFFGFSDYAKTFYREAKLFLTDFLTVIPARLDRGKQIEWPIKIHARLKAAGYNSRLVIMDFHSQGDDKKAYREELKILASEWGLNNDDTCFLSEFNAESKHGSPHSLVRELQSIANLFIFASTSESYSLATQEAAVTGNLLILNEDFSPMRDIYGPNALYFKFSSNIDRLTYEEGKTVSDYLDVPHPIKPLAYPEQLIYERDKVWYVKGEAAYAEYIATRIIGEFTTNKVLKQKQIRLREYNTRAVFKTYLEPLLYA